MSRRSRISRGYPDDAACEHVARRGTIDHLAVHRDHRGRGVARRLLDLCSTALAGAGVPRCNVFGFDANEAGVRFWRRDGFEAANGSKTFQRRDTGTRR